VAFKASITSSLGLRWRSAVLEPGRAILLASPHRLFEVLRRHSHEELSVTLQLDRCAEARGFEPGPHHPLRERDALRAPAVDLLRERERLGHQVGVRDDLRDEPDLGGFTRADVTSREHDFERTRGADGSR
jgi:hypothetical protein